MKKVLLVSVSFIIGAASIVVFNRIYVDSIRTKRRQEIMRRAKAI